MGNVYIISTSPFKEEEREQAFLKKYADYMIKTGYVAMGWGNELGDYRTIQDTNLENELGSKIFHQIRRFQHITVGDLVITPFSINYPEEFHGKAIAGYVTETYNGPKEDNFNEFGLVQFIRVNWINNAELFDFSNQNNRSNCHPFTSDDFWYPSKYEKIAGREESTRFKMAEDLKRIVLQQLDQGTRRNMVLCGERAQKNTILYGPPGTGKTFVTKARALRCLK